MPKKDKLNKEPSDADPRASWEEGVQESEDDKSSKEVKSGDPTQVITTLQSQFQAQIIEMQEAMQEISTNSFSQCKRLLKNNWLW